MGSDSGNILGSVGSMIAGPLGGVLGGALGGAGQTNYNPQGAELLNTVSPDQIRNANSMAGNALQLQQNFVNALQQQNGLGNQNLAFQNAMNMANGVGPNPAQQALANATGANVANQAALMAGQRGASSNPGLIARQAAMQGAGIQQQAAGQGALMQAQQQLAGQQQMAALANQQVAQQQQGIAQQNALTQGLQSNLLGAGANWNATQAGNVANTNQLRAGVMQGNAARQAQLMGGVLGAAGSIATMGLSGGAGAAGGVESVGGGDVASSGGVNNFVQMPQRAHGGMIGYADGGSVNGPRSMLGQSFMNMKSGGNVPGQAQVAGDSTKNDTVPAMLSPGEIVIPRTVVAGGPEKAAQFVAALMAKQGMKR